MGKQAKPKTNSGERNSDRKNGKAYSTGNVKHRGVKLTAVQTVLLGGGMLVNVNKRWQKS